MNTLQLYNQPRNDPWPLRCSEFCHIGYAINTHGIWEHNIILHTATVGRALQILQRHSPYIVIQCIPCYVTPIAYRWPATGSASMHGSPLLWMMPSFMRSFPWIWRRTRTFWPFLRYVYTTDYTLLSIIISELSFVYQSGKWRCQIFSRALQRCLQIKFNFSSSEWFKERL